MTTPTDAQRLSAAVPSPAGPTMGERDHGPRLHILVVEDNQVNQQVASLMLGKLGHQVDLAANGREAVTAVRRLLYDVVFMDCQMPELDGYGATAAIRGLPGPESRVPIIAMTANAMPGDRERCLAVGMDDYVSKPLDQATLAARLARWGGAAQQASPASIAGAVSVLNRDVIEALLGLAAESPGLFRELVGMYLSDLEPRLAGVRAGLAAADAPDVVRWAHSLRGSSANLGAERLATLCGEVEVAARRGDLAAAAPFAAELDAEAARVRAALTEACAASP